MNGDDLPPPRPDQGYSPQWRDEDLVRVPAKASNGALRGLAWGAGGGIFTLWSTGLVGAVAGALYLIFFNDDYDASLAFTAALAPTVGVLIVGTPIAMIIGGVLGLAGGAFMQHLGSFDSAPKVAAAAALLPTGLIAVVVVMGALTGLTQAEESAQNTPDPFVGAMLICLLSLVVTLAAGINGWLVGTAFRSNYR